MQSHFNNEQFSYTAIPAKDFWVIDDDTFGFENGKGVNFTTPTAKGPDTEGITVAGNGFVYLASECDNSDKGVNYNVMHKIKAQFLLLILITGFLSYGLFQILWMNKFNVYDGLNPYFHFLPVYGPSSLSDNLVQHAKNYEIPDSDQDTETIEMLKPQLSELEIKKNVFYIPYIKICQ
ncbi:MAG: hypothetical protein Q4B56_06560 [Erysipelotrichaceae bacterium]|nr:hypothetical protein [Erysipelotrichaceae bacterium]